MTRTGLATEIQDQVVFEHAVQRFRDSRIVLPTFSQLAEPWRIDESVRAALAGVDPDADVDAHGVKRVPESCCSAHCSDGYYVSFGHTIPGQRHYSTARLVYPQHSVVVRGGEHLSPASVSLAGPHDD